MRLHSFCSAFGIQSFNSRTLGRVRPLWCRRTSWPWCFNSRTLGRVRLIRSVSLIACSVFQFTHPGKGATPQGFHVHTTSAFQFTHPGKGATFGRCYFIPIHQGFNSRTLGRVRREDAWGKLKHFRVSIHAPWEGCDLYPIVDPPPTCVSIHAPWEGCDFLLPIFQSVLQWFQFTHPGKGATALALGLSAEATVSIHAPWEGCDGSFYK